MSVVTSRALASEIETAFAATFNTPASRTSASAAASAAQASPFPALLDQMVDSGAGSYPSSPRRGTAGSKTATAHATRAPKKDSLEEAGSRWTYCPGAEGGSSGARSGPCTNPISMARRGPQTSLGCPIRLPHLRDQRHRRRWRSRPDRGGRRWRCGGAFSATERVTASGGAAEIGPAWAASRAPRLGSDFPLMRMKSKRRSGWPTSQRRPSSMTMCTLGLESRLWTSGYFWISGRYPGLISTIVMSWTLGSLATTCAQAPVARPMMRTLAGFGCRPLMAWPG